MPGASDGGEPLRRLPRHDDEALTGTTRAWLRKLTAGRRPLHRCVQHPRAANQIAWRWSDTLQVHAVLDDLLTDRRGGRTGFPPAIVHDLRCLRDHNQRIGGAGQPPGCLDLLRCLWPRP